MRAVLGMRAHLLLALLALGACKGAKPEARSEGDTIQLPPVIIVTKSEIRYDVSGQVFDEKRRKLLEDAEVHGIPAWSADERFLTSLRERFPSHDCNRTDDGSIRCVDRKDQRLGSFHPASKTPCEKVVEKVPSLLYEYEPRLFSLAMQIRPTLLASCNEDGWSEPLKACILASTPKALVREHACSKLVSPELSAKIAGRFGLAPDQVQAMPVP
jgi:hypothetical protein